MSQLVAIQRGHRTVPIEKLTECEECHRWFSVTVGIELVPGKPVLRLCVRDFLISMRHRVNNPDTATGDGGNSAPVAGSDVSLTTSSFVCEPEPVAAPSPRAPRKPRRKAS